MALFRCVPTAAVLCAVIFVLGGAPSVVASEIDSEKSNEVETSGQLVVIAAQNDYAVGRLRLEGKNFGALVPSVVLSDRPLEVVSWTAQTIDAILPPDLDPGTYLLLVSAGKGIKRNDVFHVTLGAEGPTGETGPPGPAGEVTLAGQVCSEGSYLAGFDLNGDLICKPLTDSCADADSDGVCSIDGDCDDHDPSVNPGAPEVCGDLVDNNCDGSIDEGCANCTDDDADGWCVENGDCDDSDPGSNPGAVEVCGDLVDNDCDGIVDDGCGCVAGSMCDGADADFCPEGVCDSNGTCVESSGDTLEECNGIDDDCDGEIDEGCA